MSPSAVHASSGLLPDSIEEITLAPGEAHGWEVALVSRSAASAERFNFTGGGDPRTWLAFQLVQNHAFEAAAALEVAGSLFEPFLPPGQAPDHASEPYGMAEHDSGVLKPKR